MVTYLKDKFGRVIGILEEGAALPRGHQILRNHQGKVVGSFDGKVTRDGSGLYQGEGNILLMLLEKR